MKTKLFVGITTLLLIILFVYTALAKLWDYTNFQFGLSESPVIAPFAGFIAWALPITELLVAVLLAIPVFRLAGLYASFVLLLLFTVYIAAMLGFAKEIPCSCGGVLEEMSWGMHIVFNGIFLLLTAIAIARERKLRKAAISDVEQVITGSMLYYKS